MHMDGVTTMEDDITPVSGPDDLMPACPSLSHRQMERLWSTEPISNLLLDTPPQPSPNSQCSEPCLLFSELTSPNPNIKRENSIGGPHSLVSIQTLQGPVAPHELYHNHSVGIAICVDLMEAIPSHLNIQANKTDLDPLVLIQSPHDVIVLPAEEVQKINQTGDSVEENVTDSPCDIHVLTCVTQDLVSDSKQHQWHINEQEKTSQSKTTLGSDHCCTAAPFNASRVLCESRLNGEQGREAVSLKPLEEQNESPNEVWLDACQYHELAGEEERVILVRDEWTRSPITGSSVIVCPDNTKGSGFLLGEEAAIGQGGSESDRWLSIAPVERSVSTDSWYSALSEWTVNVTEGGLQPEDFTTASIKAQDQGEELTQVCPQMPMAIQNKSVELLSVGHLQDRKEKREDTQTEEFYGGCISAAGQGEPKTKTELVIIENECPVKPRNSHSKLGPFSDKLFSPNIKVFGSEITMTEAVLAHAPLSFSSDLSGDLTTNAESSRKNLYELKKDNDISLKKDRYLQEDSVGRFRSQNIFPQPQKSKHVKDAAWKVTEDSVSQLGGLFIKEEGEERNYGSLSVSCYSPGSKKSKEDCVSGGDKRLQCLKELRPVTNYSNRNTDVWRHKDVEDANEDKNVSTNSKDFHGICSQEKSPQFVIPVITLAPLSNSVGQSLDCHTLEVETNQSCPNSNLLSENKGQSCGFLQPNIPPLPVLPPCFQRFHDNKISLENKEENVLTYMKRNITCSNKTADEVRKYTICSGWNVVRDITTSSLPNKESADGWSLDRKKIITVPHDVSLLGKELSNCIIITGDHVMISEKERIAYFTLDQEGPLEGRTSLLKQMKSEQNKHPNKSITANLKNSSKMPNKTRKHSKKDKLEGGYHLSQLASKPQENLPFESHFKCDPKPTPKDVSDACVAVVDTFISTENITSIKAQGKKKKHSEKHSQNATVKAVEPLSEAENGVKPKTATKGKIDVFEAKFGVTGEKSNNMPKAAFPCKKDNLHCNSKQKQPVVKDRAISVDKSSGCGIASKSLPSSIPVHQNLNDGVIKKHLLSVDKYGKHEPKVAVDTTHTYSEGLKKRTQHLPKVPRVVQAIQAMPVGDDPQSLRLWCQFTGVFCDYTITWTKEGAVLTEIKRSAGDESRVSLTITKASSKDLGKYVCSLLCSKGSVILEYLLTYEVLSEIVIPATPPKFTVATPNEVVEDEEAVNCSCLLFRENFLSDQYFGENQPASLITEKEHFGEGMHRKAFRTRIKAGMVPVFTQGHPCVLKVHNAMRYGTKNNEELVQKNYNLAIEECHVQNTAREYIKAWTTVVKKQEAFGEVPEIIPIYLVHRPSNDIPYATLEEELMGDFVKYSVRDGKEINLKRRDSEAGQKCCAFQHWVYQKTEGNLLITDMQGVGMRLTDVGIATCKKGYKGFKGNCATSFIDQFKALHLCNNYCEVLGLNSLQPKPKKVVPKPKPTQPETKKKVSGPTLKCKP
ncbi:hypothetical protein UPYG_G00287260 [Umbra pygmaea]|uniref:non-specific serine/threonine protein kinase n=1 Tax=Umbra pygmaea TaxID=75934 RepID=A0ABD0W483_UMBPY